MIEFRKASVLVTEQSGARTILQPTSLKLSEQRISVIGANGSGKSTLARLVNGLIEPDGGSILVTPADAKHSLDTVQDGAAVRRAVGFLFTNPDTQLIMPTVLEDVALSLRRAHHNARAREVAARAILERFGLIELADRSVHDLSGGQKQLVAIASLLATDPAIIVADEPTTLLDLRNARMIGELLFSLPQQVIVVTHDLDLAAQAERTLVVDAGKIGFDGDPDGAVAYYRELVR